MTLKVNKPNEETHYLSSTEVQRVQDMADKTKILDHCVFYDYINEVYNLICHGNAEYRKVWFNQNWITTKELAPLIRKELNISNEINIVVRVLCCYGAYIDCYRDEHTLILSALYNKSKLNLSVSNNIATFKYVE